MDENTQKKLSVAEHAMRDMFAMQALNGLIAGGHLKDAEAHQDGVPDYEIAHRAYLIADQMLEARQNTLETGK